MSRDAVERRRPVMAGAAFLGMFDLFPLCPHPFDRLDLGIPEDMRMTSDQLVEDPAGDGFEIESLSFAGQLAMENHLKQQIAELFEHFLVVFGFDGIEQFVDFLHGMITERAMGLFAVPGTTGGRTQTRHDRQQILDRAGRFGRLAEFR